MTTQERSMAASLRRAVETARRLDDAVQGLGDVVQLVSETTLMQRTLTVSGTCVDLLRILDAIAEAAGAGHSCRLQVGDEHRFEVTWQPGLDVDITGTTDLLLDEAERPRLQRCIDGGD